MQQAGGKGATRQEEPSDLLRPLVLRTPLGLRLLSIKEKNYCTSNLLGFSWSISSDTKQMNRREKLMVCVHIRSHKDRRLGDEKIGVFMPH